MLSWGGKRKRRRAQKEKGSILFRIDPLGKEPRQIRRETRSDFRRRSRPLAESPATAIVPNG